MYLIDSCGPFGSTTLFTQGLHFPRLLLPMMRTEEVRVLAYSAWHGTLLMDIPLGLPSYLGNIFSKLPCNLKLFLPSASFPFS